MNIINDLAPVLLEIVEGVNRIIDEARSFEDLEASVRELIQTGTLKTMSACLTELDKRLYEGRDKARYELLDMRKRTLVTCGGELVLKRRYYRDLNQNKNVFILDDTLGLEARKRISPGLQRKMLSLGVDMPFRQAAAVVETIAPGISPMRIWQEVQQAGARAAQEAALIRQEVYEDGVFIKGQRQVERLNIEADGVLVKVQKSRQKQVEIKLFVGYEGKAEGRLTGRRSLAGIGSGHVMWEEASAKFCENWDLQHGSEVHIGGDGAAWIKEGLELYPGSQYHLDPFHLKKRLTESLRFSESSYKEINRCISDLDRGGLEPALKTALQNAKSQDQKKRLNELKTYLENNWNGLSRLPLEQRLGVIEGQVRHTIARRMKRIGGRWTIRGADHMARLLAARANDELHAYAEPGKNINRGEVSRARQISSGSKKKHNVQDTWLDVNLPVLNGPHSGRDWVKRILKKLVSSPAVMM